MFLPTRGLPVPPKLVDSQRLGDGHHPVLVVGMGVGQDHAIQPCDSPPLEPRHHRSPPNPPAVANFATRIDESTRSIVTFQERRVSVTHVQPRQPQTAWGNAAGRPGQPQRRKATGQGEPQPPRVPTCPVPRHHDDEQHTESREETPAWRPPPDR